jgi:hypothetical protein
MRSPAADSVFWGVALCGADQADCGHPQSAAWRIIIDDKLESKLFKIILGAMEIRNWKLENGNKLEHRKWGFSNLKLRISIFQFPVSSF